MRFYYLISFLEGFSTLAVQIVTLRAAVPIMGSSIVLTSIYIGVILLALSTGYYLGGIVADRAKSSSLPFILCAYLLFSGLYYMFLTFGLHEWMLTSLLSSTKSHISTLFITAFSLFFLPVCIASQTIPILTEMVPITSKGKSAGSMLFSSTVGSFVGSIGTSLYLFQMFGIIGTSIIVGVLVIITSGLTIIKQQKFLGIGITVLGILLGVGMFHHSSQKKSIYAYHFDSAYQEIAVRDITRQGGVEGKVFHTNGSFASAIYTRTKESPFEYIRETITLTKNIQPSRILVIGTAGFTYPQEIAKLPYVKHIDAVDIDPSMKRIAEQYFLEEPLNEKITFYPQSARYFVNQAIKQGKEYDLIFIDAFNGRYAPPELLTVDFFLGLNQLSEKENIMFNMILDNSGQSSLYKNSLSTMQYAFGDIYIKDVSQNKLSTMSNFIATGKRYDQEYITPIVSSVIYTDDKNSIDMDLVSMWRQ